MTSTVKLISGIQIGISRRVEIAVKELKKILIVIKNSRAKFSFYKKKSINKIVTLHIALLKTLFWY